MTVLVVGASGFVGSAVLRAGSAAGLSLRTLSRHPLCANDVDQVVGDLLDAETVARAVEGVDMVIHCAHPGPAHPAPERASELGTGLLCSAASVAGVRRLVLASTTAVYGSGPHCMLTEYGANRRPVSPLSRARALAEDMVLGNGGTVARSSLTIGSGDRFIIPTAMALHSRLGWVEDGRARQSLVHIDDLARALLSLGASATATMGAHASTRIFHVAHTSPASVRSLVEAVAARLGVPLRANTVSRQAASLLAGDRVAELIAVEHTYASDRVWSAVGWQPARPATDLTAADLAWYAEVLSR